MWQGFNTHYSYLAPNKLDTVINCELKMMHNTQYESKLIAGGMNMS